MRILLIGEYSNVHATLAAGLRALGHQVTVVSNGDFWKDYPRDIDVMRRPGKWGGIRLMAKCWRLMLQLRGYDVVQLINPMFFELKAARLFPFYRVLRRQNKKMFLGAFGMDYYWVHENITRKPLRYSDFNLGDQLRLDADALKERTDWLGTKKEQLNRMIAENCDGIITGLYEYWACYHPLFPNKTTFIPFPILPPDDEQGATHEAQTPVKVFVGISKQRNVYKGTDIMLAAAQAVKEKYPNLIDLQVVEGLPFAQYRRMMQGADLILDQLYSYTPAMNALEAMKLGVVNVGGGEPENYEILGEKQLRPIINVEPTFDSVFQQIENVVLHPDVLTKLKAEGKAYIRKHHDYIKVAERYVDFWNSRPSR